MARPIFCVTHPRACSTAFERVFMTRQKDLACVHEPFGDAFYYGPERLSSRYENDEQARVESGFSNSTFKTIFDRIEREGEEGKRLFIKDIIHYLLPPDGKAVQIAPSLQCKRRGIGTEVNGHANGHAEGHADSHTNGHADGRVNGNTGKAPYPYATESELGNPTVVPEEMLRQFHFTFLIRDPHSSIPSYYRCTIPPLDELTGFYEFYPSEAGYDEVRRVFDYLVASGQVGPHMAGKSGESQNGVNGTKGAEICVVDADDMLDNPEGIIQAYCKSVGLDYDPGMLNWDNEEDHARAKAAFEKWKGFHEDAIDSKSLKPRVHKKKQKSEAEWDAEWKETYGEKGAKIIRDSVDQNMADYLYMKQFAMKV